MSHTESHRRRRERGAALQSGQRQALVLFGSFAIGIILELVRSLPVVLAADWRLDTLIVLAAAWACGALLLWWRDTKTWGSPAVMAMLLVLMYLGTLLTHVILAR